MRNLAIELLGGPQDGYSIECLLTPPPYFLLPTPSKNVATIYYFERVCFSAGISRLRYVFSGYQAITAEELQELKGFEQQSNSLRSR
ncbi:hypothetical protein KBF38_14960 [bacterium]|nr:hypothetical protein [bacterium]